MKKGYFITGGLQGTAVREGLQHCNQALIVGQSNSAAFRIHVSYTADRLHRSTFRENDSFFCLMEDIMQLPPTVTL